MKTKPILQELEAVKERLAAESSGGIKGFLDQMESWLDLHPHPGPVVNSPEELQARLRMREATEPLPPSPAPYRIHDPIVAGIHRVREAHYREQQSGSLVLKDEPSKNKLK